MALTFTLAITIAIVSLIVVTNKKSIEEKSKPVCASKKVTKSITKVKKQTTVVSTTQETTKPPAAPITKKYIRKKKPVKVVAKPKNVVMLKVPYVSQLPSYPTGCEAASATMLLKFYGYNVSMSQVINSIPREDLYKENDKVYGPSIYQKFVGNPAQRYTDPQPGYGAFSPVVTRSINSIIRSKGGNNRQKISQVVLLIRY